MSDLSLTPSDCNQAALRRASRRLGQLYDLALSPTGLTSAQFSLIKSVDRLKNPSQSDLATDLVMNLSALGHTLKPLVRDGLLTIFPDPNDRRKRRIRLTDAGSRKLKEAAKRQGLAHARFESLLGRNEAKALRQLLDHLASQSFTDQFLCEL
ncbi:DNA-binding MarR family transcriptional regulator [Paraburkholderia sp. GAS199]|uniref:MarR family winged helix-turn-helix transcriptional regulator n=1 Tax=Paraburkholderia sp. GAS199 TaxID=3035126 RepID=UPI003D1B9FDC